MGRSSHLIISTERAEKIWQKHKVELEEAREAFETGQFFRGPRSDDGGRTYIVRGRTDAGRRLWLLVKPREGRPGVAILITARED